SNTPGAYMRFGDGDLNLTHCAQDQMQPPSEQLAFEMREAFALDGDGIMVCLPLHSARFGKSPGMSPGMHEADDATVLAWWERAKPLLGDIDRIYSPVALHYVATFDRPRALGFLRMLKSRNPIFVGNKDVPESTLERLFGAGARIPTPTRDAYAEIDRIERETLAAIGQSTETRLIVLASGCSGRVLQKRLMARGLRVFIFDFGSLLDALAGWDTRTWISMSGDLHTLLDEL
ncbi:MAG: DUF1792 domain-containing protein, partial [Actinobacteria bacterium]